MKRPLPPAPEPAITVELLREWLEGQPGDDTPVGIARGRRRCPVANCLGETYDGSWSVDAYRHRMWTAESRDNPNEISHFVTAIDSADDVPVVTRGEALAVLNRIAPEGMR